MSTRKVKKHPRAKRPSKKRKSISPLLRWALEILEHGLWHFFRSDTTTDMKFAVLHVDQCVELLLKERVRKGGRSIFKNPKETISIWGAYDILKELGCAIPEKPDLELLHEERNNIQHKYGNPDPEDASFQIESAIRFIARFLKDELATEIADYVPAEYLEQLLGP